ncbi:unnamed protein product [Camellia sinensis]
MGRTGGGHNHRGRRRRRRRRRRRCSCCDKLDRATIGQLASSTTCDGESSANPDPLPSPSSFSSSPPLPSPPLWFCEEGRRKKKKTKKTPKTTSFWGAAGNGRREGRPRIRIPPQRVRILAEFVDFSLSLFCFFSNMEVTASSIVTSIALVTLLTWAWKVVKWVWLRPKLLEKWLREQGFKGNPYKLLFGDTKEMIPMMKEARSKPIDPYSDDIVPHFLPFHHHCVNLHVSTKGSCELDVFPYLESLTGDIISRTSFGSNYEEGKKIFELQKEQTDLTIQQLQSIYIPGWRFLPTKTNKRMKAIYHEVGSVLRNIINKRERTMKDEDENNDLLGILLKTNLKEIQEKGNKKKITLTIEEITMILNEVLRLYSPASYPIRAVHKKTRLGELLVPPGLEFLVPITAIHHYREIWGEDATEFKPERFAEGIIKATKGQSTFFPFSGGPRVCIGKNFAMVE